MCRFCDGKFHGENMTSGMYGDVVVVQSNATLGIRLAYRNEGTVSKAININFCPMCGRKLEAKDETAGNV